jgi:hypothetical protein
VSGPTRLLGTGCWGPFLEECPGREADCTAPLGAGVKNTWTYNCAYPQVCMTLFTVAKANVYEDVKLREKETIFLHVITNKEDTFNSEMYINMILKFKKSDSFAKLQLITMKGFKVKMILPL